MNAGCFVRRMAVAAIAAALAGCALQSPPSAEQLRAEELKHTAIPEGWKGGGSPEGSTEP